MLTVAARIFTPVEAILFPPRHMARSMAPPDLPDAELELRGNPQYPGHDANGFRNLVVPGKVDVVAMGDSHTYGVNVAPDQAWPRALEELSSCRVYSMALGGYGPLEYAVLAQRALRFKPSLMLIGIYFGNDFYDDWQTYLRSPGKCSVPMELLDSALESERRNPLSREVKDFFGIGQTDAETEPED